MMEEGQNLIGQSFHETPPQPPAQAATLRQPITTYTYPLPCENPVAMDPTLLILDVREKETGQAAPPTFPQPKPAGFPQPKKRLSAFKQQKRGQSQAGEEKTDRGPSPTAAKPSQDVDEATPNPGRLEKQRIDRENRERIQNMSPGEIEAARQELFSSLDPSLLQRLLKRADLDDSTGAPSPFDEPDTTTTTTTTTISGPEQPIPEIRVDDATSTADAAPHTERQQTKPKKSVSFAPAVDDAAFDEDAAPAVPPADLFPIASSVDGSATGTSSSSSNIHFPRAPPSDDLDPADPNFLQTLHEKYFPNLPADPSRLAWMAPLPTEGSAADRDSPYYPGQNSLPVSQLRFDFRGRLLPPRVSRAIPVSKGLHHHGEAPEAAGYTVGELARLARSVVPAQRCLAFQTLGRILYRLGRGEWGGGEDALAAGIWRCAQEGRVLDSLDEAAAVEEGRGHQGSRAYATEAIWLFEKGGWREKWKGR